MNMDFFRTIGQQLASLWRELKVYQRFTVIMVISVLLALLGFLLYNATTSRFVPLFSEDRLTISDAAEVKSHLEAARVEYTLKGDTLIMVPAEKLHALRMDLAAAGLPKMQGSKGFELFDSNTWIKGEKELAVLEMRALKGELERDISAMEGIRSANVKLDIPTQRAFGGTETQSKASVIVNLQPGARLTAGKLSAITYHVSGAVHGLTPNMVAISDTTGKLYQALDPNGDVDLLAAEEVSQEERLKSKVDGLLSMVVGPDNYYSSVQIRMSREKTVSEVVHYQGATENGIQLGKPVASTTVVSGSQLAEREKQESGTVGSNNEAIAGQIAEGGNDVLRRSETRDQTQTQYDVPMSRTKTQSQPGKIVGIYIGVTIDKNIAVGDNTDIKDGVSGGVRDATTVKTQIYEQLKKIIQAYGLSNEPSVEFADFDRTRMEDAKAEDRMANYMSIAYQAATVLFVLIVALGMLWTLNRFWKRHMLLPPDIDKGVEEEEVYSNEPSLVEVEGMIEAIKMRFQNDPSTVGEVVSEWLSEENDFNLKLK